MNPIVEKVYQIGIIPVIAFNSADEALPLCKALAEGGLPAAEVTFRTACAEECIRKIHEEMPEMLLGDDRRKIGQRPPGGGQDHDAAGDCLRDGLPGAGCDLPLMVQKGAVEVKGHEAGRSGV